MGPQPSDSQTAVDPDAQLVSLIGQLVSAMGQATSLSDLYPLVAEGARSLVNAESALLNLVETGDEAVIVAAAGARADELVGMRTSLDSCISGTVIRSGDPVLISDMAADERARLLVDESAGQSGCLVAPLVDSDAPFGVLGATASLARVEFTERDLERLATYSEIAASCLASAERLLSPSPQASSSSAPRPLHDLDEIDVSAMVETSPDGMVLVDEQGTMLVVNSKIETMFGYDRAELLGRPVEMLLPDQHRQVHTAHRTRYRVDPRPRSMGSGLDLLAQRSDRTEFAVEVSLAPLVSAAGTRVVATVRDIEDRIQAESFNHAVQASIDAIHDGVYMFDAETLAFTYVNQGAIDQVGYTRDELLSMNPLHIKPEHTAQSFRALVQPLIDGEIQSLAFTTHHRRKDGLDVPVEIDLQYPQSAVPGQGRMFVALARDVTERVVAEQALRVSEESFRSAFDAAPVGIAMVDFTDTVRRPISECNDALCAILGYSKDELIGIGFSELTYAEDSAISDAAAQEAAAGTRTRYAMEKRYVHADGHPVWVWVHSAVLHDEQGNPTRGMVQVADLSDRKQVEEERERARRWLSSLAEIRNAALVDAPIERTLTLVCEHAVGLVDGDAAAVAQAVDGHDEVHFTAFDSAESRELLPQRLRVDDAVASGLAGETLITGASAPDAGDELAKLGTSVLIVPVESHDDARSVLLVARRSGQPFDETDLATAKNFAVETTTVLQLHAARSAQSRLQLLEDRERLARDLHDTVIQRLFASGMALQSLMGLTKDQVLSKRIGDTVMQLDQTINELRSAIFNLNTPSLLVAEEIASILERATTHLGFVPQIDYEGDPETIPGRVLEQLYPTLSEALSNVARHASATVVNVVVANRASEVEVTVTDDGVGVDPHAVHGHGLQNLQSRAQRVGGSATLDNRPTGGAIFTWKATLK